MLYCNITIINNLHQLQLQLHTLVNKGDIHGQCIMHDLILSIYNGIHQFFHGRATKVEQICALPLLIQISKRASHN